MALDLRRRLFTVDEYHRMGEVGVFEPDERVELLDGEILEMTPIGAPHAGCVKRLARLLIEGLGRQAVVGIQDPVSLDDRSEPVPDLSVARPRPDGYSGAHPRPDDLHLVIEVAVTSQLFDRNRKIPRYAATGVLESWLVDLDAERVEVHREPASGGYARRLIRGRGDVVSPEAFPHLELSVDEILGSAPGDEE